jgi:hypothetical protein
VQLQIRGELPFVTASLTFRDTRIEVADVLVDTGAASTILNADFAAEAGVYLDASDRLRVLRGVGGRELVFVRLVDRLAIGDIGLDGFEVEIGEMDYGFRSAESSAWTSSARQAQSSISASCGWTYWHSEGATAASASASLVARSWRRRHSK